MANPVNEKDLGLGLDQYRPETKVGAGFVTDVRNWDPKSNGSLTRRAGWERVGGSLPLRVKSITMTSAFNKTWEVEFFDVNISEDVPVGPIMIAGSSVQVTSGLVNYFGTTDATGLSGKLGAVYFSTFTWVSATTIAVTSVGLGNSETYVETDTAYGTTGLFPGSLGKAGIDAYCWGIPNQYAVDDSSTDRSAWVTGLVPYTRSATSTDPAANTLTATFRGNLHVLVERDTATGNPFKMPSTTVNLGVTSGAAMVLGRALYGSHPVTPPTRGYLMVPNATDGFLSVSSAVYDSGTGYTTYTLVATGYEASDTLTDIVRIDTDYLRVQDMGYDALEGEFLVKNVTSPDADTLVVVVDNAANREEDAQRSDSGSAGRAGVFTDRLPLSGTPTPLAYGDSVPTLGGENVDLTVLSFDGSALIMTPFDEPFSLVIHAPVAVTRTSSVVPATSVTNFVRDDQLAVGSYERTFRATNIVTHTDEIVSISADGLVLTVPTTNAAAYNVGDQFFVSAPNVQWSGAYVVTDVDASNIYADTTETFAATTSNLHGHLVGIDEAISLSDDDTVVVPSRWRVARGQPANLRTQSNAFVNRRTLGARDTVAASTFPATAVVGNCVYMSNGVDLVHKWDGETTYPAGLFPFAPSVGVTVIPDYFATVVNRFASVAGATADYTFNPTTDSDTQAFNTQSSLVVQGPISSTDPRRSSQVRNIANIDLTPHGTTAPSGDVKFTTPTQTITSSVTAYVPQVYRYLYRYAYTDARGNVTYSAASQSQDTYVTLGQSAAIAHKLLNYPSITFLPFERLTLEIYRTGTNDKGQADGGLPFYRIASLPLNGNQTKGIAANTASSLQYAYGQLSFVDTLQPEDQSSEAVDPVVRLYPANAASAGTYLYPPPRAKAMTSIQNRLVCGNIKSVPRVELALRPPVSSGGPVRASSFAANATKAGVQLVFRRNGATTATTDEKNVKTFEWVTYAADDTNVAGNSFNGVEVYVNAGSLVGFRHTSLVSTLRASTGLSDLRGLWIASVRKKFPTQMGTATLEASGWYRTASEVSTSGREGMIAYAPVERAIPCTSTTAATGLVTSAVSHLLAIGTPVMIHTALADTQGLQMCVQYYAYPVSDTTFRLYYSLASALAGGADNVVLVDGSTLDVYTTDMAATGPQADMTFSVAAAPSGSFNVGSTASYRTGDVVVATATGGGLTSGTMYFVRVLSASNVSLYTTLANALANTSAIAISAVASYTLTRRSERALYTVCYSAAQAIPVPVFDDSAIIAPSSAPASSSQAITLGASGDERLAPEATFLRAIRELGRAINMTTTNGSPNPGAQGGAFTTPAVYNNAFLTARWGGDTPYASLLVESPDGEAFTVEARNTTIPQTNSASVGTVASERMLVFSNGVRLQNSGLGATYVTSSSDLDYFTVPGHGLTVGQAIRFQTTSADLPLPMVVDTPYYVIPLDANTFAIASSESNARAGIKFALSDSGTGFHYYTVETAARELTFPSRLSVSFANFPEMHDRPFDSDATVGGSQSIIDIAPDDGEEIEAVVPAYGDSFSNAAQQEGRLVVTKTRSIYMVDVVTKEFTKIQSLGHGAYYPRTVVETKDGILLADREGIYKVNRSGQLVQLGLPLGRAFTETFDGRGAEKDVPVAIHDVGDHCVRIAWPLVEDTDGQTGVAVYDHTREATPGPESSGLGAWTVYDSLPTTAWAEWDGFTYRGTREGVVLRERKSGDATDFRDDASSYTSTVDLRPMDFDAMGDRKRINRVSIQFRRDENVSIEGIRVYCSIDNDRVFQELDVAELAFAPADTNLSDTVQKLIYTISYTVPVRKAEYFQIRIVDEAIDEPVEITQVTYLVDMLDQKGTKQAGETTR